MNFTCNLYARTYSVLAEKRSPAYPFVWKILEKGIVINENAFENIESLKEWLKEIVDDYPDNNYALNGYSTLIRNKRRAFNFATHKRDMVNICSFRKEGQTIRLRDTTNKRQRKKKHFTPTWKLLISQYHRNTRVNRKNFENFEDNE